VKTASEMTYIVSSGALNSTPTNHVAIVGPVGFGQYRRDERDQCGRPQPDDDHEASRWRRGQLPIAKRQLGRHVSMTTTAAAAAPSRRSITTAIATSRLINVPNVKGGSVAEWLACWTQAQKGLGSNRSRDAVG